MNNTEIFELCETSSKKQCTECAQYWDIGIAYCVSGRFLCPTQDQRILDENNFDAGSIPGWVIRKNNVRGAKHGPSERQCIHYKAKTTLQKAKQPKHGGHKTFSGTMAQRRKIQKFFDW